MSWIAIILAIIKYAPELIDIIKQVIDLIHKLPLGERNQHRAEIAAEIEEAKKSGDKTRLRELLEKLKRKCDGVGCAPATLNP